MKIIDKYEVKERIKKKYPNQPFEIIYYTKITKSFVIKCCKCNKIKEYSSTNNFLGSSRKYICSCYNEKNKDTIHLKNKEKIMNLIEDKKDELSFIKFDYNVKNKHHIVFIKCKKCNQVFTKTFNDFLKNPECYYCQNKQKMNTQSFRILLGEEYELLSDYVNTESKVLIKHKKCGFIWKRKAHSLISSYIGCPKCNYKRSKGEQRIERYLKSKNIEFFIEKSFEWQSNKRRRYDFYVPQFNSVIEYMGEQHYIDKKEYFGISLTEQQKIDKEKKEEALTEGLNYIEISYKDYNKIEKILSNYFGSTTI